MLSERRHRNQELVEDRKSRTPADKLARAVVAQCQAEGLLVQARGSHGRMNVIRLVPPMVSSNAQIDQGMFVLGKVLRSASHIATSKAA